MANVLIFGDSITYGCWDEEGGWANRLKQTVEKDIIASHFTKDHFIYPLGIPGETTYTLLQRFKQETDSRVVSTEHTIFLFAIGINDSIFNNKTNSHVIPLWKFKNNLLELYNAAARYSTTICFIGLTPVDETKVDPMPWVPESSYKNEYIKSYNRAIKEVCQDNKINYIDILSEWEKQNYHSLLLDGVHPNTQGHENLFNSISTVFFELLRE